MRKLLFEFEDLPWFPDSIRRSMVDFLSFFLRKTDYYAPVIPLIAECLERTGRHAIVDLCSGGGGPIPQVQAALQRHTGRLIPCTLTDKFPNIPAYRQMAERSGDAITFEPGAVDAATVPGHLQGLRTCFSAFHHFSPTVAASVLQHAVKCRVPIAVFDGGDRNILTMLGIALVHPVIFFFCTPFFKPFRLSRLLFTYLIPIIPLCTIWDGLVSITRLYRPQQLRQLAAGIDDGSFHWEAGIKRHRLGFGIAYLIGYPR